MVRKSAPIVALYDALNFLLTCLPSHQWCARPFFSGFRTYWFIRLVFPTPLSPRMITYVCQPCRPSSYICHISCSFTFNRIFFREAIAEADVSRLLEAEVERWFRSFGSLCRFLVGFWLFSFVDSSGFYSCDHCKVLSERVQVRAQVE